MTPKLKRLVAEARARPRMTAAEREEQTRNFAVGNVGLENERVTRAVVDRAAEAARRRSRAARIIIETPATVEETRKLFRIGVKRAAKIEKLASASLDAVGGLPSLTRVRR